MKQVIVVNNSLSLPKGKLAAQVAHAAVASLLTADAEVVKQWLQVGMPKVVLKATDEKALLELLKCAKTAGIPAQIIRDAGKTVVAAGTITCLGLGPETAEKIDLLTKELKLL